MCTNILVVSTPRSLPLFPKNPGTNTTSRETPRVANPYLDSSSTAAGGIRQMHNRSLSAPSDSASTEERRGQPKPTAPGASNKIQVRARILTINLPYCTAVPPPLDPLYSYQLNSASIHHTSPPGMFFKTKYSSKRAITPCFQACHLLKKQHSGCSRSNSR